MSNVDWKAFFEAVTAFLGVLTVAIGLWNRVHIRDIRNEQERLSAKVSSIASNGANLTEYLHKTGKDGP